MLRAEGLSLGSRLADVSFRLEKGTLTAVVGPNGAGKSTLLQVVAGLLNAEGRVFLDGQDLSTIPYLERGRLMTWLGQESHADFGFSVRDVVAQGRYAWGDDGHGVDAAMEAMDIVHLAQRPVTNLSGGERRRTFLARALANNAPVQLWDEPTANLDVRHGLDVYRRAREFSERGGTLLVSLHEIRTAFRFDQVMVLDSGRLMGIGRPHDVLTPDLIRRIFRVEARLGESLLLELPDHDSSNHAESPQSR
jgi:iron complex transport system ATP-binding protein